MFFKKPNFDPSIFPGKISFNTFKVFVHLMASMNKVKSNWKTDGLPHNRRAYRWSFESQMDLFGQVPPQLSLNFQPLKTDSMLVLG